MSATATIEIQKNSVKISALVKSTVLTLAHPVSRLSVTVYDPDLSGAFVDDDVLKYIIDGVTIFQGVVRSRTIAQRKVRRDGQARYYTAEAVDLGWRCAYPAQLISKGYVSLSDQAIIQDLISRAGLASEITAPAATVAIVEASMSISFGPYATLTECLNQIAAYTGGVWYCDAQNRIVYNTPSSFGLAPVQINQELPTPASNVLRMDIMSFRQRHQAPGTTVKVVGAKDSDGIALISEFTDTPVGSKVYARIITDESLATQAQVDAVGQTAVANLRLPQLALDAAYSYGQLGGNVIPLPLEQLRVTSAVHGLVAEDLTIERVVLSSAQSHDPKITITAGLRKKATMAEFVKKFQTRARATSSVQTMIVRCIDMAAATVHLENLSASNFFVRSTTSQTFMGWVYLGDLTTAHNLFQADDPTVTFTIIVDASGRIEAHHRRTGTNGFYRSNAGVLTTGRWHHITYRHIPHAAGSALYVDAVEVTYETYTDGSGSTSPLSTTVDIFVGKTDGIDGCIREFSWWDAKLPIANIRSAASAPDFVPSFPELSASDQMVRWVCDQGDVGSEVVSETDVGTDADNYHLTPDTPGTAPVYAEEIFVP